MQSTEEIRHDLASPRVRDIVNRLLKDASGEEAEERRAEPRQPFLCPVTIDFDGNDSFRSYWAFTRDISAEGVGLVHNIPLPLGVVTLGISRKSGEQVHFRADIQWCESCDQKWYISGGRLLDAVGK